MIASNSLWNISNFRASLVRSLAGSGYRLVIAAPAAADDVVQWALPGECRPIPLNRSGRSPVEDAALFLAYLRLFRRERPVAFLGWTIKPNIYGALAARMTGVPSILNVSGLGTAFLGSGAFGRFTGWLYRIAFARAAVVFFQNRDDQTLFVERGLVTIAQARLLPGSGIDLDRFSASPVPRGAGGPTFLLIARLLGDKGVREYVAAARSLRTSLPGARFQLLGPVDLDNRSAIARTELDSWIAEGAIEYLATTNDVRPFIAKASAVVLPSYREGLPRTLLEGAAMGRPLIATDVPGCRDVVSHGGNGFLCRPRDAVSLADAMRRFAELDDAGRAAMGRASRQIAQGFSENKVTEAYLGALRELGLAS